MLKTHLHPSKIKQIVTIASKNKTKQKQSTLKTTYLSMLIFNLDSHRFHVVTIFGLLQNTKIFVFKLQSSSAVGFAIYQLLSPIFRPAAIIN